MLFTAEHKKISARLFGSTTSIASAVVDQVGSTLVAFASDVGDALDAVAAELKMHVDSQAIASAMTPMAKEFFFLAAVFIAAIVPRIASRCSASSRHTLGRFRALAANAAAPLAAIRA
jgi:hypothetical protein